MIVSTDFECGNGKNVERVAPGHFRLEEVGEKAPYCKYFCLRLQAEGDGGLVRLDVYPDPALGESGRVGMMGHYPSQIWYSTDEMDTWRPVDNLLDRKAEFHETHITVWVRLEPGVTTYVASNPVVSYSRTLSWARSLAGEGPRSCHYTLVGESFEGREIPALHLPAGSEDAGSFFLLAGQHPSEHLGVAAVMGAVEFLLSRHPEAEELRRRFAFWACPMINVDGNAHGRNGWTMQDVNMSGDFAGVAAGGEPQAVEDRALWRWLAGKVEPDASLQFHGYMGKRSFIDPPYDGLYTLNDPASVYVDEGRADLYCRVRDTLIWDTDGFTGNARPGNLGEGSLEYQMARAWGTIPSFYEINHGYHGIWAAKRKGAAVLRAMLRGLG